MNILLAILGVMWWDAIIALVVLGLCFYWFVRSTIQGKSWGIFFSFICSFAALIVFLYVFVQYSVLDF